MAVACFLLLIPALPSQYRRLHRLALNSGYRWFLGATLLSILAKGAYLFKMCIIELLLVF